MSENLNNSQNPQPSPFIGVLERLEALSASVWEQMKETDRKMQETDRQMKETDRRMKEAEKIVMKTSKEVEKTSRQMKDTDKRIKELRTQFISQSGHIVEGLMEPAAINLFKNAGFDITSCWKEMKASIKQPDGKVHKMEVDLYYHDTTESIAVEVKINCTKEKVDHFLNQMQKFKEFFPRFSDVKVYAAIAALNYERGADEYAAEQGLFVIRVTDNDVFTLDAAKKEDRRHF